MLVVREQHEVRGRSEEHFDELIRTRFAAAVAEDDGARLLWFTRQAHGTGPAYHAVTLTGVRDGAAWERLTARMWDGDLAPLARELDEHRHAVTAKVLRVLPWCQLADLDLASVPVEGVDHEPALYMEDTGWPHAALADYVGFWETGYWGPMKARPKAERLLDIELVMVPAWGAGRRKEAVLWQRILDHDRLLTLLTTETDPVLLQPGQFMHEALGFRDRWESRLLRTTRWSPFS